MGSDDEDENRPTSCLKVLITPALVVDSDRKDGMLGIPDGTVDVPDGTLDIFGVRCGRADNE